MRGWGRLSLLPDPRHSQFSLNLCFHLRNLRHESQSRKKSLPNKHLNVSANIYITYDKEIIFTFTFSWKTKQNVYYCKLLPDVTLKCYTSIKIRLWIMVSFSPSVHPPKQNLTVRHLWEQLYLVSRHNRNYAWFASRASSPRAWIRSGFSLYKI